MINLFIPYITAFSFSFIINVIITHQLIRISHRFKWYDNIDHRKIHTGNIPRIGGIGFVFSFFSTLFLFILMRRFFPVFNPGILQIRYFWALLAGSLLIHLLGIFDDFFGTRARYKLIFQFIAALIVVISGKYFESFYVPFIGKEIQLGFFSRPFTVLWIVGITNAFNLIDGMDGLSGGMSSIILFFMGLSSISIGDPNQALVIFILLGTVSGFIIYNFPPAKLFMGDSGSLFLGFFLSCMPLYSFNYDAYGFALIISISFMLIPILDTLAAIIRRRRKGLAFHVPDSEHLHHKLLKMGLSPKQILLIVYSATILLSAAAYIFIIFRQPIYFYLNILLWLIIAILFLVLHKLHHK